MKKQEILHIYTRVSTGIQEEEGTSLDTQLEEGIKRSKKLDMGYKHWNEGGQSGSKDDLSNRPVLVEILNQIDNGIIKQLYVWNTDRLSRSLKTWGMIRVKLIQNDITLHTPTGKQQLSDLQTNLMIGIMSEISQYDNQLRTERFRLGRINKIRMGYWKGGHPPYGYELYHDGRGNLLTPNEIESKWVNKIFEWYSNGTSIPIIKDKLLQNGVISRRGNPVFSERSISNILLENTFYQGYWNYTDKKSNEKIRVDCPSIVSSNLILNVRELYESRKYKGGYNKRPYKKYIYLLNDLFECGHCGGVFRGWKSDISKQNPYYSCTTNRNLNRKKYIKNRQDCDIKRNLNMNITDELVWKLVLDVITQSNLFKQSIKDEMLDDKSIIQTKTDVKKLERKLKQNNHLIQRISESIVNQETDKLIGIRSEKEIQDVLDRLDIELLKLKSKKEEYQNEISNRNQKSKWVDWVNEWGNRLDEMKRDDFKLYDKRKFLKTIIEKIVVKSKDKLEHELSITFKFPYVNDKLVYKDNTDKSKGYILKDGRYSKKLRIHSLKKN
jgi:DNA invertase Pin-like site-specific DNA recombinase